MTNFIQKIKQLFNNIDKKDLKIMNNGLKFCSIILLLSMTVLITYLFFINNTFVYQIGILLFQLSIYFAIDFVVAGVVVDSLQKQLM